MFFSLSRSIANPARTKSVLTWTGYPPASAQGPSCITGADQHPLSLQALPTRPNRDH